MKLSTSAGVDVYLLDRKTRACSLLLPISYGVKHTNRRSEGKRILSDNNKAIVLHQGGQCRWGGGNERMVDSSTTTLRCMDR